MSASDSKSLPAIGFLTVIENDDGNLFGGYLVLNTRGRPLEFHCTAPVVPNRAQEILYGPTLRPFLFGEQIAATLVGKAKTKPLFVCTDTEPAMSMREFVKLPVVYIAGRANENDTNENESDGDRHQIDGRHQFVPRPKAAALFALDGMRAGVSELHTNDQQTVVDLWKPHAGVLDLAEPFTRIREAIEEAQGNASR